MEEYASTQTSSETLKPSKAARTGASITLLTVLCGGGVEAFGGVPVQQTRVLGLGIIALIGVILLCVRFRSYLEPPTAEQILRFYRNPHYWGVILLFGAAVIYFTLPFVYPIKPIEVAAKIPAPIQAPPPSPPLVPAPAGLEFPAIKVSAVVLNGKRSSVVVNGETVMLGERFLGVRLIQVTATNITVQSGERTMQVAF